MYWLYPAEVRSGRPQRSANVVDPRTGPENSPQDGEPLRPDGPARPKPPSQPDPHPERGGNRKPEDQRDIGAGGNHDFLGRKERHSPHELDHVIGWQPAQGAQPRVPMFEPCPAVHVIRVAYAVDRRKLI